MSRTNVNISISLDQELLKYVDEVAEINGRTRSGMIAWFIKQEFDRDIALEEEVNEL